jgi:predicted nucleic acid-binding protein
VSLEVYCCVRVCMTLLRALAEEEEEEEEEAELLLLLSLFDA